VDRVALLCAVSAAPFRLLKRPSHRIAVITTSLCLALSAGAAIFSARAQDELAQSAPVKIALLVTARDDRCFDSGYVPAIKYMAALQRDRINEAGGIAGRPLELEIFDDDGDAEKAAANVGRALADKQMLAMVGLTSSMRAKAVFASAGPDLKASGMPWLSNISINSMFADYPNVFTMRGAQEDDSIPVMAQFVKDMKVSRPAFVSVKDLIYSSALRDGLKARIAPLPLVADYELTLRDDDVTPEDVAAMIEDLRRAQPDFLFLSIGSRRTAAVLPEIEKAGIKVPIFVTGRLERIFSSGSVSYSGDIYQLAWDGLPDAYNDRLRRRLFRTHSREFLFEGARNPDAPGWASGECKEQPAPRVLSSDNLRAVAAGMQFGDMIALIAETLKSAGRAADIQALRGAITDGIKTSFVSGSGVFPGEVENWSFRPLSRAAARTPFINMRPKGLGSEQLAPIQYVGLRNDTLRQIHTLYLDIDLTRAFRIDDREKSFVAEFYLSMHLQDGESLDQIEFANAFLDPQTNNKQITITPLHQGGQSDAYPGDMKIYAVSGKFMFEPNFGNYPFDTQRFSIDIRSKSGDAPFIIQPSPNNLRDQTVMSEGWTVKEQYVGYDEDFLPVIDAKSHARSVVPFYKGSFVWVMKREATDYFLTVVVPLAFLMIIAYLTIFIPLSHFEAIVTIQVTALLSAVALYLTISKVSSDAATVSDKIFLFDYMAISLMIGISILRINGAIRKAPRLDTALVAFHLVAIPILVVLMTLYVLGSSMSDGQTASAFLPALRQAVAQ
jgi:hypothetical protein